MKLSICRRGVKALGALGAGCALALGLVLANPALAEPRVALVIGNSAYQGGLPALPNPANDAKLMAKTLKSVGFDVVEAEDAGADQIKQAIAAFSKKLAAAGAEGTGLFFYAGHGVQVAGENYLIPIDAKLEREADVALQAVAASTVLQQMDFAGSAVNIIILDACRNNPLPSSARSASRGLAEIKATPRGSFIAYSTAPGSTAADGDGVNSPYTTALAEVITQPGLSIADVFQEVRTKVLASTGNTQTPWDSSSLTGRFYFKPPEAGQVAALTPPPATPAAPAADDPLALEKAYWESVADGNDSDAIELYLLKYPNGLYVERAKAKLAELNGGSTQVASADAAQTVQPPKQPDAAAQTVAKPAAGTSFILQSQTVYAKDGGQVRAEPSSKARMLSKLPTNAEVTASGISTDGKWWRVQLADGQTGYMHNSVVSEQPVQMASAEPAQPAATRTLSAEAFVPVATAEPQPPMPQGNDVAQQLLSQAASQFGISIPQTQSAPQPQPQQMASSLSFDPIAETIKVRQGTQIYNAVGGQPIFQLSQGGPLLATARSSDGRWFAVSLPNGGTGYVGRQYLVK
ncbi:caspase family protein [Dongia sp.]|uniref:caspase family protein n=1 Tax=Dongia sp. TaxID=1977262 RepID=UPI0037506774